MGAWIETYNQEKACKSLRKSPLTWGRELKLWSLWRWRNGSCRPLHGGVNWNSSAPYTETASDGRPLHGGVNWNIILVKKSKIKIKSPLTWGRELKPWFYSKLTKPRCRPLHGGVNWNSIVPARDAMRVGRPLHGGVNWNYDDKLI